MELFIQKSISLFTYIAVALSIFWFTIKVLRHLLISKTISTLRQLPADKKEQIIHLYRGTISINKLALPLANICFLLFLIVFIMLSVYPDLNSAIPGIDLRQLMLLAGILLVTACIHFVEDSLYKQKILNAIIK